LKITTKVAVVFETWVFRNIKVINEVAVKMTTLPVKQNPKQLWKMQPETSAIFFPVKATLIKKAMVCNS
jgi:hypothetical protein